MSWLARIDQTYRRTGANLPSGDPTAGHAAEMEGYFWRFTDVASRRVVVVLCGVNRHPDGDWATVALAAHPGGFVRSAVLDAAHASSETLLVEAGDGAFRADENSVHIDLGPDAAATFTIDERVEWPHALGGGGLFSAVPFLGQYWHPHVLGGVAQGNVTLGDETWELRNADVYAEKNWGAGFPERWWWGQAQGFDDPDVCVAFGGGLLTAGPLSITVGGLVARVGGKVLRFAPPLYRIQSETDAHTWTVTATGHGTRVHIVGTAVGDPHVLPVPLPAERRNVDSDFEHLAGEMTLDISGRVNYQGKSTLAGLEVGTRPVYSHSTPLLERLRIHPKVRVTPCVTSRGIIRR